MAHVYQLRSREDFSNSLKIHENCGSFLLLNFCLLRYMYKGVKTSSNSQENTSAM